MYSLTQFLLTPDEFDCLPQMIHLRSIRGSSVTGRMARSTPAKLACWKKQRVQSRASIELHNFKWNDEQGRNCSAPQNTTKSEENSTSLRVSSDDMFESISGFLAGSVIWLEKVTLPDINRPIQTLECDKKAYLRTRWYEVGAHQLDGANRISASPPIRKFCEV